MKINTFPGMFALRYPLFHPDEERGTVGIDLEAEFGPEPGAETTTTAGDETSEGGEETSTTEEVTEETGGEETSETTEEGGEETSGEETTTAEGEEDEEEPPKPNKDWKDRQIIKARNEAKAERELREAAESRAKALEELYGDVDPETGKPKASIVTPEQARADALKVVRQEQYFEKLNTNLGEMDTAGSKAFPKTWETRIAAAREIFSEEMASKPHFIEAVTDLPNSAAVYHELAGNPDEFERVLNLPPVKMGMELAKLSTKLTAPKPVVQVSRAPAPIKPLDKPGVEERSLEDLANDDSPESMAEFDRRMRAEEDKRFKEQQSR